MLNDTKKAKEKQNEKMRLEIDEMVKLFDRQMLEDTILEWEKNKDLAEFVYYLKSKRLTIKT